MPASLFLYFLYFSSLVMDLFFKNCLYSRFFFLQACFNELVIHGLIVWPFVNDFLFNDRTCCVVYLCQLFSKCIILACGGPALGVSFFTVTHECTWC